MEFCLNVATEGIVEELIKNPNKNVVISPSSMNLILNMAASGSSGKTLKQFLRILGSKTITDLNSKSSSLMSLLDPETETETETETPVKNAPVLSMVNLMFVDHRYNFLIKPSFQEIVRDIYKTEPTMIDFKKAEKLINEVNSWAEKNTKGLIKEILPHSLKLKPPIILANAIYFKATWMDPFKASSTRDEDFHLLNGTAIKVPFMTKIKEKEQSYGSFEDFKVLRLYYNPGDRNYYTHEHHMTKYCMDIILPHRKDGLQDVLHKFNSDTKQLALLKGGFKLKTVRLTKLWIPKWKFSYGFDDPIKLMEKLGLTLPFIKKKMTMMMDYPSDEDKLYIKNMVQTSYIEVDEGGTYAASVSLAHRPATCGRFHPPPPPEVKFVADHPFMFIIREEYSGAVIFTGAVLNPLSDV